MNDIYLSPTRMIDSNHPHVQEYAERTLLGCGNNPVEKAIRLYNQVRDDIIYNPYLAYHLEETYQASRVIAVKKGHCVSKASLLCALGRAVGIPSRLGFATVRNHIATKQLIQSMGSNEFVYHGYTEFFLNDQWVIATPAFDRTTCERHHVDPLEFDGHQHSRYQAFNKDQNLFMEYLESHGSFADVPLPQMMEAFRVKYGDTLVDKWIVAFDTMRSFAKRRFDQEDVVTQH